MRQIIERDGLLNISVEHGQIPEGQQLIKAQGRHRDDLELLIQDVANLVSGLEPVHFGHLDVHQDEIESNCLGDSDRFPASIDSMGVISEPFQKRGHNPLINDLIIDDQDF